MSLVCALCYACSLSLASAPPQSAAHWPEWRGPFGTGVAPCSAPTSWSDEENVRWSTELPGRGVSTPVIYGERVFVTTAVPASDAAPPPAESSEGERGPSRSTAPSEQSFEVLCFDRRTGEQRWRAVACRATPHEGHHASYGSYASSSPVIDANGERIYVSFGSRGIYAYDLDDGKLAWSFDLGAKLAMRNAFGEGLTPVLAGDTLVQVCDQEHDSFVVGIDRRTGKELWRKTRDEPSTWATPLVTSVGGVLEVVTAGSNKMRSYAPSDGTLLWEHDGLGLNVIPAIVRADGLALAMSGYKEPVILALRLDALPGAKAEGAVAWSTTQGCAYTASPVLADGLYYTVNDRGAVSCFDAATGEVHYLEQRLPRGSALKASPVAAGEFLYFPTEDGEVHVVRRGPTFEVVRSNALADQTFIASPAVAEGELYLRGEERLFCIAESAPK